MPGVGNLRVTNLREVENSAANRAPELVCVGAGRPEGGDGELIQDVWTD